MSACAWFLSVVRVEELERVLAIEALSHPTPWPRALFEGELSLAWARVLGLRASPEAELAGYIDYWIVHDELHVLNVAVEVDAAERGTVRSGQNG